MPQGLWRRVPEKVAHWPAGTTLAGLNGGAPRPGARRLFRDEGGRLSVTDRWGRTEDFEAVIVTCQSWLMSTAIDTEERLFSQEMWMALDRTRYMQSSKTFVMVDRPFWRDRDPVTGRQVMSMTLTDRLTRGTYLFDLGEDRPGVICLTYSWMSDALKMLPLPVERRVELALGALEKIYPTLDIRGHIIGDPITVSWESDPNFLGAFKGALPGHYRYNHRMYGHFMQAGLPPVRARAVPGGRRRELDAGLGRGGGADGAEHGLGGDDPSRRAGAGGEPGAGGPLRRARPGRAAGLMADDRLDRFARNLDWNLLRTYVVVVQEGSVTGAANRLLLQQPAVSMALRRLEETIGHRLIDRRPGYFEMTEAGRKVYLQAREIFGAVVRLPDLTAETGIDISGHVSIYTISNALNPAWDAMLERFFREHPGASVSFTVETTANVIRAVERKVATLGLCDGVIPELMSKTLFARERHGLFCGRGHRFHGVGDLRLDDLRGEPYISFTADVLGGQHMGPVTAVRAFASFGQWVRAASSNVEEVQRMIRTGIGIGMLPVHLSRELVARGDLWQLPPYEDQPVTEIFQIFNPGSPLNAAETVFLERCREVPACDHL